jgi:hypothetical protein
LHCDVSGGGGEGGDGGGDCLGGEGGGDSSLSLSHHTEFMYWMPALTLWVERAQHPWLE